MATNESQTIPSWRLVHDGEKVLALLFAYGTTQTKFTLFEADTKEECLAEIARLGLEYVEIVEEIE